jgi:hypothetical protein
MRIQKDSLTLPIKYGACNLCVLCVLFARIKQNHVQIAPVPDLRVLKREYRRKFAPAFDGKLGGKKCVFFCHQSSFGILP